MREIGARMDDIRDKLESQVHVSFAPENCDWYARARAVLKRPSARQFSEWISEECRHAYEKSPVLQNELLNRNELSSAAAKARRLLIEAMVTKGNEERLGLKGFPPELSMYRSVLETPGLHRRIGDQWRFGKPVASDMAATWTEIDSFFTETERKRLPLVDLYARLRRPPFGLKNGPIPVVACAALLAFESEVAIHEAGTFIPHLNPAVIERLLSSPEPFKVRRCKIAGVRLEVLERLGRAFLDGNRQEQKTVLNVVRQIMRSVGALHEYVRMTTELSEHAQKVREALLTAKDPAQLLFLDLPAACGFAAFAANQKTSIHTVDAFFAALRQHLGELQMAYPNLLARVEQILVKVLSLPSVSTELRATLSDKAKWLLPLTAESKVKAFLLRASDTVLDHQDWIVSLATHLVQKPPSAWRDVDEQQFSLQLLILGRRLRSIEALTLATGSDALPVLRVSVAGAGTQERERVVDLRPDNQGAVEAARMRFVEVAREILSRESSLDIAIGAIGLVAQELLAEADLAEALITTEAS